MQDPGLNKAVAIHAAAATNYTGYMNAIAGSGEYLDDSLKGDPAVNMPEEYADRLRPSKDCSKAVRELRTRSGPG